MIPQRQILLSPSWLWFETATICSRLFRHPAPLHSFCYPVVGARGRNCVESDAIRMIVVSMELQWRFFTVTGVLLCTQGDTSTCVVYCKIFEAFHFCFLFLIPVSFFIYFGI